MKRLARLSPLILPVALAVLAGFAMGLESPWPAVGIGLITVGVVAYILRERQTSAATRLSAGAWWRLAIIGLLLFVLLGVPMLARQRAYGLVRPPRIPTTRSPESVGISTYRTVSFSSFDGLTLRGWYVPPENGAVVIFVHGLGGNRGTYLDQAGLLCARGYGALLLDLRNSGESDGDLTTMGLLEARDVRSAVDFVLAQPGVDAGRVGIFGHSMGGAAVLLAGARDSRVSAVVAESTYTSLEDNVADSLQKLSGLPAFPFAPLIIFFAEWESGLDISEVRPIDAIASISPRPVLIIHGERDGLISVANARALYAAAEAPKSLYIIPEGRHYALLADLPEEYSRQLVSFFDRYLLEK